MASPEDYESDTNLGQLRQQATATPDETRRWPNGVIPYVIDDAFDSDASGPTPQQRQRIVNIMNEWRVLTRGAVRFVPRDPSIHPNYIRVTEQVGGRCRTGGKRGMEVDSSGEYELWLDDACSDRIYFHELGHVMGLEHEQSRSDRDSYIQVGTAAELAAEGWSSDFNIMPTSWDVGPFDLESIMLYDPRPPAIDSLPRPACCPTGACGTLGDSCFYPGEIVDKRGDARPTPLDILAVQRIYGVPADYLMDTSWCTASDEIRIADVNGDGRDDAVCHNPSIDTNGGRRRVDLVSLSGFFLGENFNSDTKPGADRDWCFGVEHTLYVGDFDGDGQDDLLCHNGRTGQRRIDYANNLSEYNGSNWSSTNDSSSDDSWCLAPSLLHIGDFNGDNKDDILCLGTNGRRRISFSDEDNIFRTTDWDSNTDINADPDWCFGTGRNLHVGDFDGNGQDDLVCHHDNTGQRRVDYANSDGHFYGTNWDSSTDGSRYCWGGSRQLFVGDVNADGRDDLLCYNPELGSISRQLTTSAGQLDGNLWFEELDFCISVAGVFTMGDFNGDGRIDALCHNTETGHMAVRFANQGGNFGRDPTPTTGSLSAAFDIYADWGSGYCVEVLLQNNASMTSAGWNFTMDVHDDQITSTWQGQYDPTPTVMGTFTVENVHWNGDIVSGATLPSGGYRPGFCASRGVSGRDPVFVGGDIF